MYSVIKTTETFKQNGRKVPRLPFIIDKHGNPLDVVNQFFVALGIRRKRNIGKTVLPKAREICEVVNFLYYQKPSIAWDNVYETALEVMLNGLHSKGRNGKKLQTTTYNSYMSSFCDFLWWAEKEGHCDGVIGINDVGKNLKYRIPVDPPKDKFQKYHIPWLLERASPGPSRPKGNVTAWDQALEAVNNNNADYSDMKKAAMQVRDELMLRLFRECFMRRIEVCNLTTRQFKENLVVGESRIWITLHKTKIHKSRDAPIPKELYLDIQDYIDSSRQELVKNRKKSDALLPSTETGSFFEETSITNHIKREYGITPQDGRGIGLTERFVDLIECGMDKKEAVAIVSQEAGHSAKSKGQTFIDHYLQAKQIVHKTNITPRATMFVENLKLKKENSMLKDAIVALEKQLKEEHSNKA
jgi:site-specific recombinase XerD